jgi:hypothetical protein
MVNNSTDINKTNHYISFEHKKTTTYDIGIPGRDLGQAYKCGGVKLIIEIPLPLRLLFLFNIDLIRMTIISLILEN